VVLGVGAPASGGALAYDAFAVTAPGLEPLAARELRELGLAPGAPEPGGVSFRATPAGLYAANLRLRTASRVVVRVAEFPARAFHELERQARRIPWERFVAPGTAVAFRVTCRKSRLYHSDAVAERLHAAAERAGAVPGRAAPDDAEGDTDGDAADAAASEGATAQLFVVRLLHDRVTISADSSGALLHRRGYRQAVAKAPLRETLAAAMLLASDWDPAAPLVDPMCGSGTIAIEAALLARRVAPGIGRDFAFRRWPEADAGVWAAEVARAEGEALPAAAAPIVAADRDAGAVAATVANAERAGVAADVLAVQRPLSALEPPPGAGWLVTNPPWGARVGEADRLRDLYARLGQVARARCPGWTVGLLSGDPRLDAQTGLPLVERFRTTAGGLRVRFVVARA
jgi:putative N6-adenine-specific DNA methylase